MPRSPVKHSDYLCLYVYIFLRIERAASKLISYSGYQNKNFESRWLIKDILDGLFKKITFVI